MNQDPFGLDARPPLSIKFVQPDPDRVVVLERIENDPEPDYCVHGRTRCFRCDAWCYLGVQTLRVVEMGEATPLCKTCADEIYRRLGHFGTFAGNADDRGHSHR